MIVKKVITITTMFLFLITGMNFYVARHYCNGKLAGEKISFSGISAGCGMVKQSDEKNGIQTIGDIDCCENHIACFSLNDFTVLSPTESMVPGQQVVHPQALVTAVTSNQNSFFNLSPTDIRPPGIFIPYGHSCPVLCIFRI